MVATAHLPTRERPRERLLAVGSAALSDAELLALILGTGHVSVGGGLALAHALLAAFGGLRALLTAHFHELSSVKGMGHAQACRLVAAGEIARRLAAEPLDAGTTICSSAAVYAHFGPLLADEKRESFYAVLLDTKNRLVAKVRISEGSLASALVHPREAFRPAIQAAAAAVIFLHNHPSGDPRPSEEDRRITARLREAGSLLGIPVLDHVVAGASGYYSFADCGWGAAE